MPFSVYITDDGSVDGSAPVLITDGERPELPLHPDGKAWRWVFTSTEEPRNVLIGHRLVRKLKAQGLVISKSPLDRLLQLRSVEDPRPPETAPLMSGYRKAK